MSKSDMPKPDSAAKPTGRQSKISREANRISEQIRRSFWRVLLSAKKATGEKLRPISLPKGAVNGVFDIYLRESGKEISVVKIPRLDGKAASRKLFRLVGSASGSRDYEKRLNSLAADKNIGTHLPKIFNIGRLGQYESEFIKGPNLSELALYIYRNMKLPESVDSEKFLSAVEKLKAALAAYRQAGGIPCGDWALHNLVYDLSANTIKNVDLEGLFTYGENDVEASPEFIANELAGVAALAKLAASGGNRERKILAARAAIWFSTGSGSTYSGIRHVAGYHTIEVLGTRLRGQRECSERLGKVPYDFTGKNVLDVGCNVGGMLHALSGKVASATGIDYDAKCINAANVVAAVNQTANLNFYTFNLEKDDLASIRSLTAGDRIDICFLLAVCMWIKNWREVIDFLASQCDRMLFESNGSRTQQAEQVEKIRGCYADVQLIQEGSPDDPGQQDRSLYFCTGSLKLTKT